MQLSILEHVRHGWGVAHCLDPVAVGIERESGIIVGVIFGPKSRRATVPPAGEQCRRVEVPHGRAGGCAEADMTARCRPPHHAFARDRKFNPEGARRGSVVRAAAVPEINYADQPEGTKRGVIEASAAINVAYTERYMVEHDAKSPLIASSPLGSFIVRGFCLP